MQRICTTLVKNGYKIMLVGRKMPGSKPLKAQPFRQKRLTCFFSKGKWFYIEYNIRLFFFLLFHPTDCLCAIDLDTIMPVLLVSKLKGAERVYDAHELFTEMKEVITRPGIKKAWQWVERKAVPQFSVGYTVSQSIAEEFNRRYMVRYQTIMNVPLLADNTDPVPKERFILYQGAVNEARGLEQLIPAMKHVNAPLIICGDGNFMSQAKALVELHQLETRIIFKGQLAPDQLKLITSFAYIGLNLVEPFGLNQLYSLANKFFDYIHAGIPQVTMDFEEYRRINNEYEIAVLVKDLDPIILADKLNLLLNDAVLYERLSLNCQKARNIYNWQEEEKKLISLYQQILD